MNDRRTHAVLLTSEDDLAAARALVRRRYVKSGYYTSEDEGDSRLEQFLKLPSAATFGIFSDGVLYGCVSIVVDSEHGLPMDTLYHDELAPLRAAGMRLAEVTQLSVDHGVVEKIMNRTQAMFASAPLFAAVLDHARRNAIDHLCISVNPKHDAFYRLLGFKEVGPMKHYATVNAPALGKTLSIKEFGEGKLLHSIIGKEIARYLDSGR